MSLQSDYYKTAILQLKRGNYNGHVSNAKTYYLLSILERIDKGLLVDNKIKFDDESKKFYETQCLAYKDVVDTAVAAVERVEVVECAVGGKAILAHLVAVVEESGVDEYLEGLAALVYVEVAGQDNGVVLLHQLAHLAHDELGALSACCHTDVVHVGVEEIEGMLGLEVLEVAP